MIAKLGEITMELFFYGVFGLAFVSYIRKFK